MRLRSFKVGGLRFIQIGRLSISFCITKAAPKPAYEIPLTLSEIIALRLIKLRSAYSPRAIAYRALPAAERRAYRLNHFKSA